MTWTDKLGLAFVWVFFGGPALALMLWLLWLFVSVVFLGRSNACPQNLC
jgi:hypothetical protein